MSEPDYLSEGYDPHEHQPGRRNAAGSSTNWTLIAGIIVGVGLLGVIVCCGGAWFLVNFGTDVLAEQIRADIEENAVIKEHIGNISTMEMDIAKSTAAEGEDEFVFRIEGDKGSGFLTAESTTVDADTEHVTGGTLKMDSGESYPLFDETDLEAVDDLDAIEEPVDPDDAEGTNT